MEAPKREVGNEPAAAAGGRGGGLAALLQLIELEDRRVQASAFFLVWGCCVMLHGTLLNRAANPEHLLAGYALFTIGAALAFLTLSGAGRLGRAASRVEETLRGYF
ncbi:unnamed protein product [Urochloa decumbens]|uniref:Uncharacterized protein n=1 Tax=Urochloa decumbens TaxID=240449 RepID=A0ABC9E262_9POAL